MNCQGTDDGEAIGEVEIPRTPSHKYLTSCSRIVLLMDRLA
jgi:hypothetical protein